MARQTSVKEPTAEQIAEHQIYKQMGVSDSEYELICSFMGRKPNYTEIGVFSVMWSEHCAYKIQAALRRFPTSGPRVLMGPGEGAGIVDIGDNQAVVFKIESHNHPSAVEPYQGDHGRWRHNPRYFLHGGKTGSDSELASFCKLESDRVKYCLSTWFPALPVTATASGSRR